MKLWRALALSVAAAATAAATCATAAPTLADVVDRDNNAAAAATATTADDGGLMAFLSNELQRSSAFVQRFFYNANDDDGVPQTVQLIVLEEDSTDSDGNSVLLQQELSRDEQQLACQTAPQIFHERDALAHERMQLSQRLRAPFKRAFQAMSLHYFDEASCDDLDDARLVAACNRFVDMESAVRAFMVRDRSDEEVCERVTAAPAVNGELSCKLCKRFVKMVDEALVQQVSQLQVVREIIGDICDSMSPDSQCHAFLNQYDQIVEWLKQGTSPDTVCARITMCPAVPTPSLAPMSPAAVAADVTGHACGYCAHITYVVAKVNAVSPDHLNFVRKLIAWGCKLAPQDCKCDVLVTNYDRIVAWVKQDKSPREICEALQLCTKTSAPAPVIASLPAAFAGLMPLVHVADASMASPSASLSLQDERTCFYCDYATTLVQIALQEQTDLVNEVRQYADLICQLLGPDNACHPYVNQLDSVIDALTQGKHPREICAAMKYCGGATASSSSTRSYAAAVAAQLAVAMAQSAHVPTTTLQDDRTCMYCDYGALVLKIILEQDAAQVDELRQAADMVCGFLGPDHVCHQYVDKLDLLIDGLKQGKHPRAICVALKYCAATTTAQALTARVQHALATFEAENRAVDLRGDSKKCFYCDYIATLLQIVLQEDAAQVDEIREYADMICGILGPDNVCHQYVDKLDAVIDGLKKGKHPREICVSLKYCTATAAAGSTVSAVLPAPAATTATDLAAFDQRLVKNVKTALESAIDSCFVCTQIASILAVAVQEDPSQIDQIRQIGDLVCGFLPSESKCRPVMNELDTVIDALKKGEAPHAICHNLKFCKAAAGATAYALKQPLTVASAPKQPVALNVSCAYCSGVVTVLEVALQQKPDEVQEARQAAGIVCRLLPSDDQCHEDLKLFDVAVMQLKSGKQPHEVCTSLKFCSSAAAALAVTVADLAVVDPSLAPSRCTICKQNSLLLASLLVAAPSRLAAFNDQMNAVCRLVPDTKECELLLKHRETIVDALARNEDIDAICTRVGQCGALAAPETSGAPAFSMGCLLCEYTAEMVKFAAKDQNELRLAKVALETMCVILPPAARCDVLSSKFDDLVALAQSGKSPSEACRAIALCGGSSAAVVAAAEPAVRADYLLPAQFAPVGDVLEVE